MLNLINTISKFAIAHHGQSMILGGIALIMLVVLVWDVSTSKGK
jgi:hypothetical protein